MSRREFVGATAAGAGSLLAGNVWGQAGQGLAAQGGLPVTRIRKVYLAKPVPSWPKPDIDLAAEMRRIEDILAKMADKMAGIQLEGGELYRVTGDLPKSVAEMKNPDGLLVFNLTSGVGGMLDKLAAMKLPVILFSQPYSGHDWSNVAALQKRGDKVMGLATSDFGEIPGACRLIQTARVLKDTRVCYVNNVPFGAEQAAKIKQRLGVTVVSVGADRLNAVYKGIDDKAAVAEAQEWIKGAVKVVEPSEKEIVDSGRLYLALRKIMEEERAQAVTINCLGLFGAKVLPAYPCLAFAKLNDLGLTGVCEGDMDSTLTQVIFTYAFGVPGFVSDPVIDTSKNSVIHAHCVSATKMDGPGGPRAEYVVRSHLEDNKGAALQVKMRVGQTITMAKLTNLETMLISTGEITDNPDVDRGCRTKITTKVADARKILNQYSGGLHRVIFYGDRVAAVRDLAALLQFKVVEEC